MSRRPRSIRERQAAQERELDERVRQVAERAGIAPRPVTVRKATPEELRRRARLHVAVDEEEETNGAR